MNITITNATPAELAQIQAILAGSANLPTTPKVSQPKADAKVYRSAKGKEQAKADVEAVWTKAKAKAGVNRVKDLSAKQRAAVDVQVKAIWAAVPKTRTTKA